MSTPIATKLSVLHSNDGNVDLFILDLTKLGGGVYHFSPQCYADGTLLAWGGQAYTLVPIGIDGTELKSDGGSLPQVTMTVSGVGSGPLLAPIVALGDLVGATITQYMTKVSYLDGQSDPDTSRFIGPNVYRIEQTSITNQSVSFTCTYPIDLPNMMFPIRQIVIDPGINPGDSVGAGVYFPGCSPYRLQSYQSQ
jgi:lambda family phage minor tail protein L